MVIEMNENIETKIQHLIKKLRPYILADGGDLEFIKYEDKNVYIRLSGACKNCPMIDFTIDEGIEQLLKNEIPEIEKVINVD